MEAGSCWVKACDRLPLFFLPYPSPSPPPRSRSLDTEVFCSGRCSFSPAGRVSFLIPPFFHRTIYETSKATGHRLLRSADAFAPRQRNEFPSATNNRCSARLATLTSKPFAATPIGSRRLDELWC